MRCTLIFSFAFFTSLTLLAFDGKYPIQNFTPKDYLAGIQNIDFAQNRDMNIFVANNLGILNYNGSHWELHNSGTGKKQRSLAFDEGTNRLYVGSQGDFGFFEDDWKYVSLADDLDPKDRVFDEVWDVFILDESVYFCTFQGIYHYDGNSVNPIYNEIQFNRSFAVNGNLFCQNSKGELFEIKKDELFPFRNQKVKNQIVAGIIPRGDDYLIIYNSGEIEITRSSQEGNLFRNLVERLKDTYVNHVLQLSDTRLVISTQTAGIFIYDMQNSTIKQITKEEGLLSNACLRTFQDYAGNLWIGKQNGIALVDINSPMRLVNQEIGIQGSGYQSYVTEDATYFTTSNGIYYLKKGAERSIFLEGTEGPAYEIKEIAGKIYAGHHTGLLKLQGASAERVSRSNGLWKIKQLEMNPDYAIAGTYSGLHLFRIDQQKGLLPLGKISGFEESSRFFEEDEDGRIWVGQYYKGLFLLNLDLDLMEAKVEKVGERFGIMEQEQIVLSKVNNEIYISTSTGLFRFDEGEKQFVKNGQYSDLLGNQEVYLFRQDRQQNIHVVAKNMVGFFKQISSSNYQFIPSSLYQIRYFLNNDLLNISVDTEEGIYFSANEGFIQYYPNLEIRVATDAPLIISKVTSVSQGNTLFEQLPFKARAKELSQLDVGRGGKVLQFEIEYFQFNSASNQQFAYNLVGFDDDFSLASNSTRKEYSNLREGEYEFRAKTLTYAGEIIESQSLVIDVAPPIYRTLAAKIFYLVIAIGALIAVARIQKRRYKLKADALEKSKQIEIDQKQQKLDEVEAQNEKDMSRLKEEQMAENLRHVNNLLAASTMNLVVKNDFISTIRSELTDLKKKSDQASMKSAVDKMVREIDTTLRIQEDWEQFEHHFDQVHGDFLHRLQGKFSDLTPSEQKLCVFLRLNLNTKEIANLLSISVRGVEVARYRLRKKLDLAKGDNLSKFILEF